MLTQIPPVIHAEFVTEHVPDVLTILADLRQVLRVILAPGHDKAGRSQ